MNLPENIPPGIKEAVPGLILGTLQALRSDGTPLRRAATGGLCATIILQATPWAEQQEHAPAWLVIVVIGAFAVPLIDLCLVTIRNLPLTDLVVEFVRARLIGRRDNQGDKR